MTRTRTAVLMILAAVLANVAFTALGSIFNYPDVLDEPSGDVLAGFREHEGAVSAWFTVLAASAALLAPIASASAGSPRPGRCASRSASGSRPPSCRWVNVPLCVIAIALGTRVVAESRDPAPAPLDWTGAALSGTGLLALVWAVIEAPSEGWTSPPVLAASGAAAALLGSFVLHQRRTPEPLLDVRLFRDARFSAASATVMVLFFALFGFLFLATQYLQFVLGFSPLAAGVRVLPYAGAVVASAVLSAKLVARFGTRRIVTLGMLLFARSPGSLAGVRPEGETREAAEAPEAVAA